ncbi:hypothetical protein D3C73_1343890 [compost metagenome]
MNSFSKEQNNGSLEQAGAPAAESERYRDLCPAQHEVPRLEPHERDALLQPALFY